MSPVRARVLGVVALLGLPGCVGGPSGIIEASGGPAGAAIANRPMRAQRCSYVSDARQVWLSSREDPLWLLIVEEKANPAAGNSVLRPQDATSTQLKVVEMNVREGASSDIDRSRCSKLDFALDQSTWTLRENRGPVQTFFEGHLDIDCVAPDSGRRYVGRFELSGCNGPLLPTRGLVR